ncbi:MAG: hypothetical protein KF819_11190 [Labilithrix sp.]|nr:hypothetical protein [Labilithrix sp.]
MGLSAAMANDDEKDELYRVDTVPPPAGEGDAYSAPTKVGPMPQSVLDAMKKAAMTGAPLKPVSLPSQAPKAAIPEKSDQVSEELESALTPDDADDGEDESATAGAPASAAPAAEPLPAPVSERPRPRPIQPGVFVLAAVLVVFMVGVYVLFLR